MMSSSATDVTPPQRHHHQQQQHHSGEPPTSRIPKPSPLPLRRSLSLRLRTTDGDGGGGRDDVQKPYNCFCEEEGGGGGAVDGDGVDDIDCSNHTFGTVTKSASFDATAPCAASSLLPLSKHETNASTTNTTATPNGLPQQTARGYWTPTHAKSLTHIAGNGSPSTMAHNCNGSIGGGAHKPHGHPHLNGKQQQHGSNSVGSGGSTAAAQQGMSLDLKQCASHHHTHHHNHNSTPNKSTEPSPLLHRRAASVNRAHSYPNAHTGSCSTVHSPLTPRTPGGTVATGANRRLSPKTPPVSPDDPLTGYADDDVDSVYSYTSMASGRSTMSCDHPFVARNGTTFSGRKMKYVVHCSSYAGQTGEDYLTPTQRAQKHIRRLKMLLSQAHMDLEQRDSEILRLTKEVVELRLFKASLTSPEDRSNSSDAVTVREMGDPKTSTDVSPLVVDPTTGDLVDGHHQRADDNDADDISESGASLGAGGPAIMSKSVSPRHYAQTAAFLEKMSNSEMQSSFADSGHFEDITCTSSVNSRDSYAQTLPHMSGAGASSSSAAAAAASSASGAGVGATSCSTSSLLAAGVDAEYERSELIRFYELKIEDLIKNHSDESQEVRVTHNDRVEALLQRLAECNARYSDLVPDHEQAKERIRELERQLEDLQQKLQEQENKQNKMYLHMFAKGQEAERIQQADKVMELASTSTASTSRVSVPELMQQLQVTQNELENIKDTNYVQVRGNAQVLLSAKEAISLWLLGARKTMYRRLIDAQQSKNKVDPEVTLQFLKSAVYYFLTDKENTHGHLNAIESILGFSDVERKKIEVARAAK